MFYDQKVEILRNLSNNVDFSPKGSIDAPVAELVAFINALDGYVTTSSCSGRISIYRSNGDILRANNSNKGVLWLLVSHQLVDIEDIRSLLLREMKSVADPSANNCATTAVTAGDILYLKCEGFILHILCKNLESATKLLQIALQVGYRESGITVSSSYQAATDPNSRDGRLTQKQPKSSVMLAIRSTAFTFEVPIAVSNGLTWTPLVGMLPTGGPSDVSLSADAGCVYPFGLDLLVEQANDKLKQNFARADKLMADLKMKLARYPLLRCGDAPAGSLRRWGHSSAAFAGSDTNSGGVVSVGGYEPSGGGSSSASVRAKQPAATTVAGLVAPLAPHAGPESLRSGGADTEWVHGSLVACSLGWVSLGGRKAPNAVGDASGTCMDLNRSVLRVLGAGMGAELPHAEVGSAPTPRWGHSCTRLARREDEVYVYDRRSAASAVGGTQPEQEKKPQEGLRSDKYLVFGGRDALGLCTDHYLLERLPGTGASPAGGVWRWTRLTLDDILGAPRCFHAAALIPNSPYCPGVLIHGGMVGAPMHAGVAAAQSTIVRPEMFVLYPLDATSGRAVRGQHVKAELVPGSPGQLSEGAMSRFGHTLTDVGAKCLLLCGGISHHDSVGSNEIDIPNTHAHASSTVGHSAGAEAEFVVCLHVRTAHNFSKDDISDIAVAMERLSVPTYPHCPLPAGACTVQRAHHQTVLLERAIDFSPRGGNGSAPACMRSDAMGLELPLPTLMLIGGGAPCLSFGTFFNDSREYLISTSEFCAPTAVSLPGTSTLVQTKAQTLKQPSSSRPPPPTTTSKSPSDLHAVLMCAKPLAKRVKSLLESVSAAQAGANRDAGTSSRCARKHGYYDKARHINPISARELLQLQVRAPHSQCYVQTVAWSEVAAAFGVGSAATPTESDVDDFVALPITEELESLLVALSKAAPLERAQSEFIHDIFRATSYAPLIFGQIPASILYDGSKSSGGVRPAACRSQSVKTLLEEWYTSHGIADTESDAGANAAWRFPKKFELVGGDVVMVPAESLLNELQEKVLGGSEGVTADMMQELWALLAAHFGCSRVARKAEINSNLRRESRVKLLYKTPEFEERRLAQIQAAAASSPDPRAMEKSEGWVTVTENKVKFGFDISKVMFCSGNCTERMRMGRVLCRNEVIYDLYCGVGYYTIPLLFHGGARRVFACEWNPNSVAALKSNLNYQRISRERATIIEGDNRVNVPQLFLRADDSGEGSDAVPTLKPGDRSYQDYPHYNSQTVGQLQRQVPGGLPRADRVMLGLLPSSRDGWRLGVRLLKRAGGRMHVHENVHERLLVKPETSEPMLTPARDVPTADLTEADGYFPEFLVRRFTDLFREYDDECIVAGAGGTVVSAPMRVRVEHVEVVKSYAPRVYHIVVDLVCER